MKTITLLCNVPLAVAVGAKRSKYGVTTVALSDADVGALSDDARKLLAAARAEKQDGHEGVVVPDIHNCCYALDVDDATPEATRVALEVLAVKRAEKVAAEAAEREERIAKILALPDDKFIENFEYDPWHRPHRGSWGFGGESLSGITDDERIRARLRDIDERVLPPLAEAWEARKAAERREREVAAEAARAKLDAQEAEWRDKVKAYVLAYVPEYARAAADGRDVTKVGARHAAEYVEGILETTLDSHVFRGGALRIVHEPAGREEREVPTTRAYEVLDALKFVVNKFLDDATPELRALLAEPEFFIERVTLESGEKVTCAVVDIDLPGDDDQMAVVMVAAEEEEEKDEE